MLEPPISKRGAGKHIAVIVVILFTAIPITIAGFLEYFRTSEPLPPFPWLILSVEDYSGGNWTIVVTRGSISNSDVELLVNNRTDGNLTVYKAIINLTPIHNDPDVIYYNNNENTKLDVGDSFLLKSSGGHIFPGYKVRLLHNNNEVGAVRELSA